MKNKRLILVLALALSSGALAWYLTKSQLQTEVRPLAAAETRGRSRMAVAARDLPVGAVLRTEDIRLVDWFSDVVPAGHATSTAELVGRGLLAPVRMNEAFLDSRIADKDSGGGLPIIIPEGMRAVSVKVDEVIGVAGFVLADTRVDVLVTLSARTESTPPTTRVILQNVRVLSAGQTYQRDDEGTPISVAVITLLVTPEQAERLTLAANEGRIQLALRNTLDVAEVDTPGSRLNSLVEQTRTTQTAGTRPVQVAPRSTGGGQGARVVETFRGGVRTIQTF
jgi:pilus assembly protein CpaB